MKTDRQLQLDIVEELRWEPALDAAHIAVAVHRGVVTLTGRVGSYWEKLLAERSAGRVREVKQLVEDLVVVPATQNVRSDQDLVVSASTILSSNTAIPANRIKLKVDNGHLTLIGDVEWQFQKDAAGRAVESIIGLKGLSNFLFVKPRARTAVVKEDIERSIQRQADINASDIAVEAIGNKVTLRGKVRTWAEKQMAHNLAWASPGVAVVVDELQIAS